MKTRQPQLEDSRGVHLPIGGSSQPAMRGKLLLSAALILGCAAAALVLFAQTQGLAQAPPGAAEYGAGGGAGYGDDYGAAMGIGMMSNDPGAGHEMGFMVSGQDARHELHAQLEPVWKRLLDAESDEQKTAIKAELSSILEDYFDRDMQWRSREIESIEQRVKRLRGQLDQRRQAKEEIIQLQLKVLENEAAGLGFFGQDPTGDSLGHGGTMGAGYPGAGYGSPYGADMGGYGMEMGGYGMAPLGSPPLERRVPKAFTKRVAVQFLETPLEQVIDFLRDACQANIYVDQAALRKGGVALDTPVSMSLRDVSIATALDLVTGNLSDQLGLRYEDDIAVVGAAGVPSSGTQDQWISAGMEASKQTERRLAGTGDYEFIETPLSQVLSFLQDAAGVDVFVFSRRVGRVIDAPVSLRLNDVKHRTALRLILDSVDKSLFFAVADGVVVVNSNGAKPGEFGNAEGPGLAGAEEFGGEPASSAGGTAAGSDRPEPRGDGAPIAAPARDAGDPGGPAVSGSEDVALLEAELRAAQRRLDLISASHDRGTATELEFQEGTSAVEIATRKLARAKREYAAQERLLELDLQRAQADLDAVQAELEESLELNRRSPGVIPATQLKRQSTAVRQAELDIERVQTLLDLHRQPAEEAAP